MRTRRPRITVRLLMALVAVAAVVACGEARRAEFRRLAALHEREALGSYYQHDDEARDPVRDRWIAHHEALQAKYGRAARVPWLPVAPDPADPPDPYADVR